MLHAFVVLAGVCSVGASLAAPAVFNVNAYGATGRKADDARPAIQRALDACAAAGGGTVLVPRGEYTSGTLHLRSRVRLEIAAGATIFASTNEAAYDFGSIPSKAALLHGEELEEVSITGEGTLDGQAEYVWRDDDFEHTFDHKDRMLALGKSIRRSFPVGLPQRKVYPHLLFLSGCRGLNISGLRWLRSPGWTITLHACEQARLEGLDLQTSMREAVWADGIDMDGCRDITIERCTVATGDDCIVLISTSVWGPARPCENITISDCRLSSASAGIKFSEGNRAGVRNVVVRDSVFTNVNRGVVLMTVEGEISGVLLSNLTIHCNRFDWFWAGDGQPFHFRPLRESEINRQPPRPGEPPPGVIRNVTIRNVRAHGKGSSPVHGHPESWIDGLTFENVSLNLAADPDAAFDTATNALDVRRVRDLRLRNVSVTWQNPPLKTWRSALAFRDIQDLNVDGFIGGAAWPRSDAPVMTLQNITNGCVTRAMALPGTRLFMDVGAGSRAILLERNDLRQAVEPWRIAAGVARGEVTLRDNQLEQPRHESGEK